MKLADLKRIQVGTKLHLVHCLLGPVPIEKQERIVFAVHSNSIEFKRCFKCTKNDESSWLYFPKAKDFRYDGDGFTILEENQVCAQYKFANQ